jgi:hypothetical protein
MSSYLLRETVTHDQNLTHRFVKKPAAPRAAVASNNMSELGSGVDAGTDAANR